MAKSGKNTSVCLLVFVLFCVVANPMLFKVVNHVVNKLGSHNLISDENGCPTQVGSIVHAVVFTFLLLVLKKLTGLSKRAEVDAFAFIITVGLFYGISNKHTYKLVNHLVNKVQRVDISSPSGCPTQGGVVLHAVVFVIVACSLLKVIRAF
tara:strand:+ start:174 stop:626 length:453 start_codon:yes stop_codon:yes gene_type:complete